MMVILMFEMIWEAVIFFSVDAAESMEVTFSYITRQREMEDLLET